MKVGNLVNESGYVLTTLISGAVEAGCLSKAGPNFQASHGNHSALAMLCLICILQMCLDARKNLVKNPQNLIAVTVLLTMFGKLYVYIQ